MNKAVRVRFAPSPTGFLHIGGVRTALFNYLFANSHNGKFILRLEDTDQERFVADGVEQIIKSLDWLGLHPDEGVWYEEKPGEHGPYIQSKRLNHYGNFAKQLVASGLAYYSHITSEQLASLKAEALASKQPFVYQQSMEPGNVMAPDTALPIRLKIPAGTTKWSDEVRGDFSTSNSLIDDFIIIKADGFPTYNFANVIDDHLMQISHVIRGDEFISSTAKHALLYDMLKFDRPAWIHLPPILSPDGKRKLSKRDGDVNVLDYQKKGYLPEALLNFLSLLGWNDGSTQEIFSPEELIAKFNIDRIQKSPAVFDSARLDWMNGEYLRHKLTEDQLIDEMKPYIPKTWLDDMAYFKRVLKLDRERIKRLDEAKYIMEIFFDLPKVDSKLLYKKDDAVIAAEWIASTISELDTIEFTHSKIETALRGLSEKLEVQTGRYFYVLRVALTGRTEAPGLFDIFETLGKQESLKRLKNCAH
ncbi:glutamate--tRNA ligase [Candidatus Saccharibacteria bacterium]|nr:glutamate--tRNA ligase [Candidatus Saccharibacteria bacterium]